VASAISSTLVIVIAVRFEIGGPEGTCTLVAVRKDPSRRQRVAPLIELRIQKWWEVLVTLQSSLPACLKTPDLQAGSRITSLKI